MASTLTHLQQNHGDRLSGRTDKRNGPRQTMLMTTGIECSYPTVQGGHRRDELEGAGHYQHWREDFELCRSIGARYLRYGIPYYRTHLGPGRYDWSFADETLVGLWDAGLIPILDLCHFGVPDWIGGFQNRDWPAWFAEYVAAFADRYPWIKFYTPVNEMFVCAEFSARLGLWNEQEKSDRAFVAAHAVQCRATLLAIEQILKRRSDAVFIQSEVAEVYLERWPETREQVGFKNRLRFITFDYLYGRPPDGDVLMFLRDNGLSDEDYRFFMEKGRQHGAHCVLGMDYYGNNERTVEQDGSDRAEGAMLGWGMIAADYYDRYHRPMMLTETNTLDFGHGESVRWLLRTWHQAQHLRQKGIPMIGYTWYSLVDQIDWDIQLREIRGKVNSNGLFTLDRKERDVAGVYRQLAHSYADSPLIDDIPQGLFDKPAPHPKEPGPRSHATPTSKEER